MPRKTKKAKLMDEIYCNAARHLALLDSSDDSEAEQVHEDLESDIEMVLAYRNGEVTQVPKQSTWLHEVLPNYDEGRFRQVTRVSFHEFDKLLHLISENAIFHTGQTQMPVHSQLALTLYRLGVYGTGGSLHNVAKLFGTGDGSTVVRATRRVIKAIIALQDQYVYWPDHGERQTMVLESLANLPNCIGWIDGTHVKLEEAPKMDKDSYYDKDKNYSLQVQLICDKSKRIRHFVAGYPGSVHDSRVWNECQLQKNPAEYFSIGQWIGGDKGYPLSHHMMTPFRENAPKIPATNRQAFNKYYSSHRVVIEHVNGILKETFGCLKELRVRIKDAKGHREATDWIAACVVIYNIIMPDGEVDVPNAVEEVDDSTAVMGDIKSEDRRMSLYYHVMNVLNL